MQMAETDKLAEAFRLDGKVAVVTGAGSGIGQKTAQIFAQAGADVILADLGDCTDTLGKMPVPQRAFVRRLDISDRNQVEALADCAVAEFGGLDIWFNAAGIGYQHALLDTDSARAQRVVDVNFMGCFWGVAAAARVMSAHGGGTIVNISSSGGQHPAPGVSIYGMTKAAVISLTWSSAAELGPLGIRVNAIAPGWIDTPMASNMFRDEAGDILTARRDAVLGEMTRRSPIGLTGLPSDIGYAALYLASDASRYVTGQILAVNGGAGM
jgi:3-oxoacyl-[acyl-carrier protein] reductase